MVREHQKQFYLLEFSVNSKTLQRMKDTVDNSELQRREKRAKKEAFWTGIAYEEFIVDFMNDLFGRKKGK